MPLTTVSEGRVYDWSHAVGRGAARGTGFNYIQTMCLGENGSCTRPIVATKIISGCTCNKVQIGGPGEEDLLADFFEYGEGDGQCDLAVWRRGRRQGPCIRARTNGRTRSPCSTPAANSCANVERQVAATASCCALRAWPSRKTATSSSSTAATIACRYSSPDGKFVGKCGRAGSGDGEFNQPWGITLDKDGNIYVADWKNHRVQKLSPQGKFLMKIGEYGAIEAPEGSFAVTMFGPYVSHASRERRLSEARHAQSSDRRRCGSPMATSMSPIGVIIGFACSMPKEGRSAV